MNKPIALITGSASGIGAATALRLAKDGYDLVLVGLGGLEATEAAAKAVGAEVLSAPLDVSDSPARLGLFAQIEERFGRLDVLVNSAALLGTASRAEAIDEDLAHFERVIAVNLTAAFAYSQSAAQIMRKTGGGVIVQISSVGAVAAQNDSAAYCTSKAGLDALTRAFAIEWSRYGIRAVSVAPGDIRTQTSVDSIASSTAPNPYGRITPLGRTGTADDIAAVVSFAVSKDASFVTGTTLRADGGFLSY